MKRIETMCEVIGRGVRPVGIVEVAKRFRRAFARA